MKIKECVENLRERGEKKYAKKKAGGKGKKGGKECTQEGRRNRIT